MSGEGTCLDASNSSKVADHGRRRARGLAGLAILAAIAFMTGHSQVPQYNGGLPGVERSASGMPGLPENANPRPDGIRALRDSLNVQDRSKMIKLLNVQRQKDMNVETGKLLTLANEVNAQTNKMNTGGKAQISVMDLHKVEMIEKLAKSVREKMTSVSTMD